MRQMRQMRRAAPLRRWRDELAIVAFLGALAWALASGGWTWRLDRLAYDLGLSLWSRPAPADIVIVAIDDDSIDAMGRWPWRRAVHATLLEKLAQARPRAVALDLLLSEPDPDPAQDRLLAEALRRAAPVVLPASWWVAPGQAPAWVNPVSPLREAARLGTAEAPVDSDGVLRVAFLQAGPVGARVPHLALAMLQAGGETVHPNLPADAGLDTIAARSSWQRDGRLLIRYSGPPGTIERISYVDVLRGKVPASRLAGRYVFVGMTAQGLGDTLATPVNGRHEAMPGVEVLANTLYTLRSGDTLRSAGAGAVAAGSAGLLALLVLTFALFGPRAALPMALASVPLAGAVSLLALRGGLWVTPVPYALAAALAYPLWSWRRLERALAGLDKEIAHLAADALIAGTPVDTTGRRGRFAAGGDTIGQRLRTLQSAGALVRQARRFLADTLAAMPTAMLVADAQHRVLLANAKAAALFEVEAAEELQDLDLLRLLAEFRHAQPVDWPAALAALSPGGEGIAVECRLGAAADCVVHVAAVELQGQRRLVVTVADIAPVKQAQREREEALAFVSHDLRSPASSIVLLADLQLQGRTRTAPDELLLELRRLAARTLALSEDFVRAAQAQSQPLQPAPLVVAELLAEALAELRPQAAAAEVQLQLGEPAPEGHVVLDRLLVVRALVNLLSNAIKHSPRGGEVALHAVLQHGRLRLQVCDQGAGLSAGQLAQLARGDQGAAVQDVRGVGLGLLFVQRVARRHGGCLRAGTAPGGGAQFELELPARVATTSGGARRPSAE